MKRLTLLTAVLLSMSLIACGDDEDKENDDGDGFQQPAGTVAVNFVVDDTANGKWKSEELEWKGEVNYDAATRLATRDATWLAGTWAKLYDDGPWTAGGHEPAGAVANDHKVGITVFVVPPPTGSETYRYGLRDATNPDRSNGGWLWVGENGGFTINAGQTAAVNAPGLTFPAKGTTDLKLTLDTTALVAREGGWDTSVVRVKGSPTAWSLVPMFDDATHGDATANDKVYTMILSEAIAAAMEVPPYPGLLSTGDKPEFVFVLGPDGTVEYKDAAQENSAADEGVVAFVQADGVTSWTAVVVTLSTGQYVNTMITVP
jgi:hypothetical protein